MTEIVGTVMGQSKSAGSIRNVQEFKCGELFFKRVGPLLNGQGSEVRAFGEVFVRPFYQITKLPYASDRGLGTLPQESHQNAIVVQEKATGAFYLMDCDTKVNEYDD